MRRSPILLILSAAAFLATASCTSVQRRPGPGELDDLGSCGWLDAPRTRGPFGYAMRRVEAGSYMVGCPPGLRGCAIATEEWNNIESSGSASEEYHSRDRSVTISRGFWIGETEVTQRLVSRVTGEPLQTGCADCPHQLDTLVEAARFANALSARRGVQPCYEIQGDEVTWSDGLQCEGYRLPTGVEWEIAARAGCDAYYAGSNNPRYAAPQHPNDVPVDSWEAPLPVKTGYPNGYGLYDMTGNVEEWVWEDREGQRAPDPVDDGVTPTLGAMHHHRGGAGKGDVVHALGYVGPDEADEEDRYPNLDVSVYPEWGEWFGARLVRSVR